MKVISLENKGKYQILKFTDPNVSELMSDYTEIESKINGSHVFIDFSMIKNITKDDYDLFDQFFLSLKKNETSFACFNITNDILNNLLLNTSAKQDDIRVSLFEALSKFGLSDDKKMTLDVSFIKPFIKASFDTIKLQANLPIELAKVQTSLSTVADNVVIVGNLSIASEAFNGSLSICFPEDVFLSIYNSMLFTEETEINEDIVDCAAELTNIILGSAKADINRSTGHVIEKAIPQVIRGNPVNLRQLVGNKCIVVPFKIPKGLFYMVIGATNTEVKAA